MKGYQPFSDWEMRIFHDGPDCDGKWLLAAFALIETGPIGFSIESPSPVMAAMGTDRTIGPQGFLHILAGFFLCQLADLA
jgi:hypothetical protein